MPPVVAAIVTFAVQVGTAIVAAVQAAGILKTILTVASIVASIASAHVGDSGSKINQGQELALKLDPTQPRQIAVGRTATGGSLAYAFTYSDNSNPNRYLVRIIPISDRPINNVVKILEATEELIFGGDIYTGMQPCTSHHYTGSTPRMWLQVFKGSDTPSVPSWLTAASGGAWTVNHKGVGIAYVVVKYDYSNDAFPNGEPGLVFVVDGVSVYDDRESTDVGGTQELSDPSTWTFSRNASAIAGQLLRGFYTNDVLIMGAEADERDLSPAMMIAANNTCDQEIALDGGGTEPRYRAGMMLTATNTVGEDLAGMRDAMDGKILDRSGQITILPGGTRTPVMDLTDEDIVWSDEKSYQPYANLSSLYNIVRGSYVPEEGRFTEDVYPTKKDNTFIAEDGGQKITLHRDFKAVTSATQVQRITSAILARSRFQKTVGFVGPLWLYELEQGDWFTLTSERWGFETKWFEVQYCTLTVDFRVAIVALEVSEDSDTWDPADEVPRTQTTEPPVPYYLPPPTVTVTADVAALDDETFLVPVIKYQIGIDEGLEIYGYDLQYRLYENVPSVKLISQIPHDSSYGWISSGIIPSAHYQVRARAYGPHGLGTWSLWTDGDVTVGSAYRVPDAASIGGVPAAEVVADLQTNAELLAKEVLTRQNFTAYQEALNYIAGQSVGVIAIDARDTADSAISDLSLIGARNGGGTAFILDADTVYVDDTTSWGTHLDYVTSTLGDGTVTVTELKEAVDGQVGRIALSVDNSLGAVVGLDLGVDGTTSHFDIVTDNFRLIDPSGAFSQVVFSYSGGMIYMPNVMIDTLEVDSVTTPNMVNNSVSAMQTSQGSSTIAGTDTEVTLFTHTYTLAFDADIVLLANVAFNDGGGHSAGYHHGVLKFYLDGVQVAVNDITGPYSTTTLTLIASTTATAGTRVFTLKQYCRIDDYITDRNFTTFRLYK